MYFVLHRYYSIENMLGKAEHFSKEITKDFSKLIQKGGKWGLVENY